MRASRTTPARRLARGFRGCCRDSWLRGDPRRFHIVSGALDHREDREVDPATDMPALLTAAREIPNLACIIVDPWYRRCSGIGIKTPGSG